VPVDPYAVDCPYCLQPRGKKCWAGGPKGTSRSYGYPCQRPHDERRHVARAVHDLDATEMTVAAYERPCGG
jgi:hypothetical protein